MLEWAIVNVCLELGVFEWAIVNICPERGILEWANLNIALNLVRLIGNSECLP